ncbi:MAG: VWA domain-containing protein, partial [Candidatus Riflebacteria bacterium]
LVMSIFRKIMVGLILLNLFVLFVHDTWPDFMNRLESKPVDDWVYENTRTMTEKPDDIFEDIRESPIYLFLFLLFVEFCRIVLIFDTVSGLAKIFVFTCVIGVLASVSGPMISSITDQGISDFGYSVGGAKDINNFRENIAQGYLPQPTDITCEGLFYDYCFNTGRVASSSNETEKQLFRPTWAAAVTRNPLTGETEHYLAVGLKSDLKAEDFKRKKLNLIMVLDISGSMTSRFDQYYYGGYRPPSLEKNDSGTYSKMQSACQAMVAMIDHLKPDDRLGIVLFNHQAYLAKPVYPVGQNNIDALKKHILDISAHGGTSMEEGLQLGESLASPFVGYESEEYENRIIFLTDAMPNTDDYSESGLLGITRGMAKRGIYTTFIGIGLDFNTQLIESITKIRGANYYSVHSSADFKTRLAEEFDYMVTPMLFDLSMVVDSSGYRIKKVIGSPEADLATSRIFQVKTLFPAPTKAAGTRGGVILLQLEKIGQESGINLKIHYQDRSRKDYEFTSSVNFPELEPEYFDDRGIRKAIALAHYADLLKAVATGRFPGHKQAMAASENSPDNSGWTYWERPGTQLAVSSSAQTPLRQFKSWLQSEINAVGDQSMRQEIKVLNQLEAVIK